MDIYLVRHTTPDVVKGVCYGQTDLDTTDSMIEEAAVIRRHLPANVNAVHSSPLKRCKKLAAHLFPSHTIQFRDDLKELDCGQWEMRSWDELPAEVVDPWMKDFVNTPIPGGESYIDLNKRVTCCFHEVIRLQGAKSQMTDADTGAVVLVTHGGPIRSILASISGTPLIDSFKIFALHYGCVVRITWHAGLFSYTLLSNEPPKEKEQHKPSSFYKK
jgi:alpha-ribazole phosphatase